MGKKTDTRLRQTWLRERNNEKAFIFDPELKRCLATFEREAWQDAISICGGNVAEAASMCGTQGIPRGARALWGRSADQALTTYRKWKRRS